jgi:hypothetical protein
LGAWLFKVKWGRCPALRFDENDQSSCGLVVAPEVYAPVRAAIVGKEALSAASAFLIGAGNGCDSRLTTEPENPEYSASLARHAEAEKDRAAAMRHIWGVR